jgi:hypothetical protein
MHQDHLRVLHSLPHAYLVLSPDLTIIDANPTYCRLTFADPDVIMGRDVFRVFPDNPGDPEASGVRNLKTSLKTVLATKHIHRMRWQRYDVRDRSRIFRERHFAPINSPILDDNGEVKLIVHHVGDVTELAKRLPQVGATPTWNERCAEAGRHVTDGRRTIARQRALIDRQRALGYDTAAAEGLLATLEEAQLIYESDLTRIRTERP